MANNESWNYAHNLTAKAEAGVSADKKDKGNQNKVAGKTMYSKTYYGLTLKAYADMEGLTYPPASEKDFKKLNKTFNDNFSGTTEKPVSTAQGKDKVKTLFKKAYWDKHKLGNITDKRVAASIYDALVNQGFTFGNKGQSNKTMLNTLKRLGVDTSSGFKDLDDAIAQVNKAIEDKGGDAVLDSYAQTRENSYIISSNKGDNKKYSRGWVRRLNDHRTDTSKINWNQLPKDTALSNDSIKKVRVNKDYNITTSTAPIDSVDVASKETGIREEYEKYRNERSGEGIADENILSYEDYYKQIDNIGSPRARKLKREQLSQLGPRKTKVEEKEVVEEKLDPKDLLPTLGEINIDNKIQEQKNKLNKKKEKENKNKEEVYQPKELVPLSSLTDEEIKNLTNEERKQYGLQPVVEVEEEIEELTPEQIAIAEEEKIEAEKEKALEEEYSQEQVEKREAERKEKIRQRKAREKLVDKDKDGIPDTVDADVEELGPKNQLTVSNEEKEVVEEQLAQEAISTTETVEMEVLDAQGNIKKITVPFVDQEKKEEVKPEQTEVQVTEAEIEEKPKLIKPKLKNFRTSGDYMKARMKYYKALEEQGEENPIEFENQLDEDEIKEEVEMEQNLTVIDASKRNIFKLNDNTNIFNSIIGDIDNLAKGIQQELNNITKSINNKQ